MMRHGQSEGNVDNIAYIQKGDCNVELTDLGWEQTIRAGEYAKTQFPAMGVTDWPVMFISPYMRTRQSTSGFLHGLDGIYPGEPEFHEDPRLIEMFFGATSRKRNPMGIMDPVLAGELKNLSQHTYAVDKFMTRTLLGDAKMDTYMRVRSFFEGTVQKKIDAGQDTFFSTNHGVVLQECVRYWKGLPITEAMPDFNNADIVEFKGEPGDCTITKIYDGALMKAVNENVADHIQSRKFSDLPAIPQHILDGMNP